MEDDEKYAIEICHDISDKEDQIKKISISISSINTYLDLVWPGLPGMESFICYLLLIFQQTMALSMCWFNPGLFVD